MVTTRGGENGLLEDGQSFDLNSQGRHFGRDFRGPQGMEKKTAPGETGSHSGYLRKSFITKINVCFFRVDITLLE